MTPGQWIDWALKGGSVDDPLALLIVFATVFLILCAHVGFCSIVCAVFDCIRDLFK